MKRDSTLHCTRKWSIKHFQRT